MNKVAAFLIATFVAVLTPLVGWAFIAHPLPFGLIGFVLLPTFCGIAIYRMLRDGEDERERQAAINREIEEIFKGHI